MVALNCDLLYISAPTTRHRLRQQVLSSSGSSTSSKLSSASIRNIIDRLLCLKNRYTTASNYLRIWRQFNSFLIKLDMMPSSWEDRVTLFIGFKISEGIQSATVKILCARYKKNSN